MKKGKRYLLLSIFIIVLSLYLPETAAAMEDGAPLAEQEPEFVTEPKPGTEPESETEPKPGTEPESETEPEPGTEPESETEPEPGTERESETETKPGTGPKPGTEPESETEPEPESVPEQVPESDMALMAVSQTDEEPDGISSAAELVNWLESHKYSGGRTALTGDIAIKESCMFVSYPNIPPLTVETGSYTIFVCAGAEFWSDGRLTFMGDGGEEGIFHVEQGGMLLLDGVAVETSAGGGSPYALWQEEGAGMILGNTFASCHVPGNIRYAETPWVMEAERACVIVEKGELLDGRLPAEVTCRVNVQGAVLEQEPLAVSWDMEGTEQQQAQRRRFQARGVWARAAGGEKPACTVVYHDFPLTFTGEKAFVRSNAYTFQGDYVRQGGAVTAAVLPEYSFDGENWVREGENNIFRGDSGYYMAFPCDQWDVSSNPYIYIRLRGETEGQAYYSNVLQYAADNMDAAEDLGGSRGGGTAIVNPPAEPEKPSGSEQPDGPQRPAEPSEPAGQEKADGPAIPNKAAEPAVSDKAPDSGKTPEPAEIKKGRTSAAVSRQPDIEDGNENHSAYIQETESGVTAEDTANRDALDVAVQGMPAGTELAACTHVKPELPVQAESGNMSAEQTASYGLMAGMVAVSAAAGAVCFFISKGTKR